MLSIGEAARLLGTTPRTLRFYHSRGVVPEPERDELGHRRYDIATLHALKSVLALRELDLPLDRCAGLVGADGTDLGAALERWEAEIVRQQERLEQRRLMIARLREDAGRLGPGSPLEPWSAWVDALTERGVAPVLVEQERTALQLMSLVGGAPDDPGAAGADPRVGPAMEAFMELSPETVESARTERLVEDLVDLARPFVTDAGPTGPADGLTSELLSSFTPAQRRVLGRVASRLSTSTD
ncbi:MerR family transcriptional regulator [Nocardiopsis prasina]|uniref:MerR family transcriptional regulator n=1 Tax=Nocardiopsis prasina TaxID=2015 RepID=UPI000346F7DE|nr:MerR family transcriptional regulator [Nocardiopsis prasina]